MVKNKQSNLIASVKMLSIGVIGPNATNIYINLLPIIIFCEHRVILFQLLAFLSQFLRVNQGRT